MNAIAIKPTISAPQTLPGRLDELCQEKFTTSLKRSDSTFARLLAFQSFFAISLAMWVSTRAWPGTASHLHWSSWVTGLLVVGVAAIPVVTICLLISIRNTLAEMKQLAESQEKVDAIKAEFRSSRTVSPDAAKLN